jgi:hypothetical protein
MIACIVREQVRISIRGHRYAYLTLVNLSADGTAYHLSPPRSRTRW